LKEEKPFEGKIALITGSGRGIGRAIALHLAERGAHIIVNFFRNRKPAEETAAAIREFGQEALVVKAHVGSDEGLDHLFERVENNFGALDILVSNAASGYNRPALQQKPKSWDSTMNINARALLDISSVSPVRVHFEFCLIMQLWEPAKQLLKPLPGTWQSN
jgi:enoyl-[acyl-carrier protein] reductase III